MKLAGLLLAGVPLSQATTLYDAIAALPNTQTFVSILKAAGADKLLSGTDTYTVFVPTDDAFAWPQYQLDYVLKVEGSAEKFAKYSIHEGSLPTTKMSAHMNITTLNEHYQLFVTDADAAHVRLNDATCGVGQSSKANQEADNGLFHLIDFVVQPPAAICPDKIFAAEQRSLARITSYGYDCRTKNETRHLYISGNLKPVGLAVDSDARLAFWANDQDYPRRSPTSWVSRIGFNESGYEVVNKKLVDPQGIYADKKNKVLYIATHSGNSIQKMNYDGTGLVDVYSQPNNDAFQPSDVVVDVEEGIIFASVEGDSTDAGSLWSVHVNGSNATKLLPNENATAGLIQNYGLCLDTHAKHVYWVQGGHGGAIHCLAYGDTECVKETVVDTLNYPYMCDIDNAFAPYGGPTRVAWTEANRPGSIYYANVNGTDERTVNVTVATDLDAPMGIAFGCSDF